MTFLHVLATLWPKTKHSIPIIYRVSISIFFVFMFSSARAQSPQNREAAERQRPVLEGEVRSSVDNTPVQGVSIRVDGFLANTDEEGRFRIAVTEPEGAVDVRHIGFQPRSIDYDKRTTYLKIQLEPLENQIDDVEVVSTGYQKLPKERATGSFVQIDNELLNNRVSSNFLERLDGIAPGLQFDNRASRPIINIRGINTLRDNALGPLIIVDNFPYEGDLENINPNNIESVTLLKDAAASSIWGARAANGVIVVTLKTPMKEEGVKVSFNGNTNIIQRPDLYYHSRMSTSDFIDVEMMLYDQGFYDTQLNGPNRKFYVISPVVDLLDKASKDLITKDEALQKIDGFRSLDYRNDMMDHIYRAGVNQQYALDLNGGTGKMSYLVALGYDKNQHTIAGATNDRLNLRLANTFRPSSKLEVGGMLTLSNRNTRSGGGNLYPINPGGGKTQLYPYAQLIDENKNILPIPMTYNLDYVQSTGNGQLLDWLYRPLDDLHDEERTNNSKHIALGLHADYKLFADLNLSVQYNLENQLGKSGTFYSEDSYYIRNLVNRFTQINNGVVKRALPPGASLVSSNSDMISHRIRGQANYNRKFAHKGEVAAFAGAELSDKHISSNSYQVYGYNAHVLTSANVDFENAYPIYDGLAANSRIPNAQDFNGAISRFVSFYMNGSYTYDNRYIWSISGRKDASNSFGIKTNSRWNPLWSTGAAWILSNEDFIKKQEWIDNLKIRGTLGFSGNSGGGNSKPLIIYSGSTASYTNLSYAWLLAPPNPYLKWEVVRMVNYGLDFSFFGNRLSGTLELFSKKSTDLISADPIDQTTGFSEVTRNVAEIRGKGYDIQLNSTNLRGPVRWQTSIALSHVQDIVTSFYGTLSNTSDYVSNAGRNLTPVEDKPFYSVFSYRFAGLDPQDGSPIGFLDGEHSKNYINILQDSLQNIAFHGSALPPYYGFIRNNIGWKNFDLSFSIAYKFGAFFRKETINYASLYSSWVSHGDYEKRWQKTGDEKHTNIPSMIYPADGNRDTFFALSDAVVFKSDLVRLQDVRIAYTWSPEIKRRQIRLNFYATANNLGLIWTANKAGLDPDYNNLPRAASFAFGLKANL
ncbi:MAG TPA: SusC/RagA family TonB-linked outer membrane protein [Sphingobacterium sp.]|nr:SusC/RagA family TonB-linked outer membrane protein [Sphingobacterium sp.]